MLKGVMPRQVLILKDPLLYTINRVLADSVKSASVSSPCQKSSATFSTEYMGGEK